MLPCGLLPLTPPVDAEQLLADAQRSHALVRRLRAEVPDLPGWVNVPLRNRSGRADDYGVGPFSEPSQPTPLCQELPAAAAVVDWASGLGFDIELARIAVLSPGAQLRAHVDEYAARRLIVPLEADPAFVHVFEDLAIAMQTGEVWAVDGHACHGAINLHSTRARAALLLDARVATSLPPAGYSEPWQVPAERRLTRPPFDEAARSRVAAEARGRLVEFDPADPELLAHEEPWLRAAYEHALTHAEAYAQLVAFCHELGQPERAAFWEARSCRCVPLA